MSVQQDKAINERKLWERQERYRLTDYMGGAYVEVPGTGESGDVINAILNDDDTWTITAATRDADGCDEVDFVVNSLNDLVHDEPPGAGEDVFEGAMIATHPIIKR